MGSHQLVVTQLTSQHLDKTSTSLKRNINMGKSALNVLAKRSTPNFVMRDKQREKRRKFLKMCVQKLRDIDDPETVLCRAVLINNTFKTLKYAYRRVFRPEPQPEQVHVQQVEEEESDNDEEEEEHEENISSDESSNSDDESVPASSSDNESDIDNDVPILQTDKKDTSYCQDELDNFTEGCDLKNFNAESIVHSLIMPPLLSPQIEDMTNCSFYDSFNTEEAHNSSGIDSEPSIKNNDNTFSQDSQEDLTATFKFAVVNNVTSNHQDITQSHNLPVHGEYSTSTSDLEFCQKSDFPTCVQSDIGNCNSILIDNLLTETVQA